MRRRRRREVLGVLALAAVLAGVANAAPPAPAPSPANLADCVAALDDVYPASATSPDSSVRSAVRAAAGRLRGALPADLGVTPFTAFVTKEGLLSGNGTTDVERRLIDQFKAGLPPEKQASWSLYNLLPVSASPADLARVRTQRTKLSSTTQSRGYDLHFETGPRGALYVRDRLGQRLRVLASTPVCSSGWVHTVDGVLWPGAAPSAASLPDPVAGGVAPASPAPAPSGGFRPVAFAADAVALPPSVGGGGSGNGTGGGTGSATNPNAIASTAFAATGAAISAAVSEIQKLSGNGTAPLPPQPPPPTAPDAGDRSSVVVGAVLGGAAGLLAMAAAASAALIYRRRRRLGRGGADGDGDGDDDDESVGASSDEGGGGAKAFISRVLRGGGGAGRKGDLEAGPPPPSPPDGAPLAAWSPTRALVAPPSFFPPSDAPNWEMAPSDVELCVDASGKRVQLGCGGFGAVYRGRYQGVTDVAVKLVTGHSPKEVARFANEVAILKALRHTNVVQFLGASLEEDPATGGRIMLVTEYLPRGDLWRALSKDAAHVFSWYRRGRAVVLDVVRGLAFMHSKKVMHLDLKSANILLGRDGTAKVADVGLAKILTRDATHVSMEGTFDWAAPEVLSGQGVSEKADIYSLSVVLWEVVTGERPHMRQMRPVRVPDECPAEVAAVIADCRSLDPAARPTAKDVYERLASAPTTPPPPGGAPRGGAGRGGTAGGGGAVGVAAASPFEAAAGDPLPSTPVAASTREATSLGGDATPARGSAAGGPGTPSGTGARRAAAAAAATTASGSRPPTAG